jgi:hypothetical protein
MEASPPGSSGAPSGVEVFWWRARRLQRQDSKRPAYPLGHAWV